MKWMKMYTRKELNGMFTEGQLVIYGGEGVCRIAAVGPSSLSGTDKTKLYYTLTPLTRSGTVLTPVDTKVLMRPILTRQEAEDLIAQLPQLPPEEPELPEPTAVHRAVTVMFSAGIVAGISLFHPAKV